MNAPIARPLPAAETAAEDHAWYKDAIIYQLHVKSFFDANNDGVGDFAGLMAKLDYIAGLGVTAVWLLPFYPSPRLDDGYDISDYRGVHPDYGKLADVRRFIHAAHERGIARHHGTGGEPHLRPASVVPARAPRQAGIGASRLLRVVRHRPSVRGHADHLPRHREVELDLGRRAPARITGIASIRTSRT